VRERVAHVVETACDFFGCGLGLDAGAVLLYEALEPLTAQTKPSPLLLGADEHGVVGVEEPDGEAADLVLAGECVLQVEEEERPLRAWDFFHCPPGTAHAFVGAGEGPCVIFITGARTREKDTIYPRSDLPAAEVYDPFPDWQPERPANWNELPWA
jgi:Cupin domain